ncbi:hypothetical protein H6P81_006189 [Aristolochia fimbriata]|uniref:Uncharacterized protein n=1 Tax=Aristolochia fimbriata TaxID=158543 RepID=A0AAV7EWK7_ARIFI|nr:hypothetical protein H6P81_006189 [Aristolochia fimbriata]
MAGMEQLVSGRKPEKKREYCNRSGGNAMACPKSRFFLLAMKTEASPLTKEGRELTGPVKPLDSPLLTSHDRLLPPASGACPAPPPREYTAVMEECGAHVRPGPPLVASNRNDVLKFPLQTRLNYLSTVLPPDRPSIVSFQSSANKQTSKYEPHVLCSRHVVIPQCPASTAEVTLAVRLTVTGQSGRRNSRKGMSRGGGRMRRRLVGLPHKSGHRAF